MQVLSIIMMNPTYQPTKSLGRIDGTEYMWPKALFLREQNSLYPMEVAIGRIEKEKYWIKNI
jgi:hypothetical protein